LREVVGLDEPASPGYEVEKVCLPCLGMLQGESPSCDIGLRLTEQSRPLLFLC
jgi:hypothetical protein